MGGVTEPVVDQRQKGLRLEAVAVHFQEFFEHSSCLFKAVQFYEGAGALLEQLLAVTRVGMSPASVRMSPGWRSLRATFTRKRQSSESFGSKWTARC